MKAIWNGAILAESNETIVVEGNHYFPAHSIKKGFFRESSTSSMCHWKGKASYYSVVVDGKTNHDAAWYYPSPLPKAMEIKNHVAFWKGVTISE